MRKIALALAILGTTLLAGFYTAPAHAQATRTWVSGVGDDANPCSRTAPCKTWAGAISKTAPGGEIDVLDPGGFGAVTITKSITIDGHGGGIGSALVAGTNGIVVNAGATDFVILRNLQMNGLLGNGSNPGGAGINGINYLAGAQVVVDNCDIFGFNNNGINVSLGTTGFLEVRNTTFRNNAQNGLSATTSSGFAVVQVYNSSFVGTNIGSGPTQGGVTSANRGAVTVSNSNFQNLNYGAQTTGSGILNVDSSLITSANNGLLAATGTTINASNNSFYLDGTAFGGTGSYTSAGNNKIVGSQGASPGAMNVK